MTSHVYMYFELQAVFRVRYRPPVDRYSASHSVRYRSVIPFIRFHLYHSLTAAQAVFIHRQFIAYFLKVLPSHLYCPTLPLTSKFILCIMILTTIFYLKLAHLLPSFKLFFMGG